MLDRFIVHQPRTVDEASRLLGDYGPEACVYAGGTELLIVLKERLAHFPHLVDIKRIPALRDITVDEASGAITIGSLATHRDIERSRLVLERVPELASLAAKVANVRVRAAGTIGGNLCFAEPHSDPATLLACLKAELTLKSVAGSREIPIEAFFTGLMETVRRHDEILTRITIPPLPASTGVAYERFKLHERPTAAVAALISAERGEIVGARVVAGCVGERPQRLGATEGALIGQPASEAVVMAAGQAIREEVHISIDAFESEAYKRHLARIVGQQAIATAIRRASGEESQRRAA